jgi:GNAT superfamily N-acetyltransferase
MDNLAPYTYIFSVPSVSTYQYLRLGAGLSGKSTEAATLGLKNTLFAVQVLSGDEVVGMGRVIGDGGCFFQVVDIAVLKAHQGRGLGKLIMREIKNYLDLHTPDSAYISLIADGKARLLYEQFGFVPVAPKSVGMAYKK